MSISTVKTLVVNSLSGIGIPCYYQMNDQGDSTYFTFIVVSDWGAAFADGKAQVAGYRVQLDGWSKSNMDALNDTAKERLLEAGFIYHGGRDSYETETGLYRRTQEFYFYKE